MGSHSKFKITNHMKHFGIGCLLTLVGILLSGVGNFIFFGVIIIGIIEIFYGFIGYATIISSKRKGILISIIWTILVIVLMIFIAESKVMKNLIDNYDVQQFCGALIGFLMTIILWIKRFKTSGKIEMSIYSIIISFFSVTILGSLVFWGSRDNDLSMQLGMAGALAILIICIAIIIMSNKLINNKLN
ncbi:MAG: hypothetical protein H6696_18180 [Deferribacteres bacterium]|nr:hypothetical protein [Deferribacteres bacterium]